MAVTVERHPSKIGAARSNRQISGSLNNRCTIATVATVAFGILLLSIVFLRSAGNLSKELRRSIWTESENASATNILPVPDSETVEDDTMSLEAEIQTNPLKCDVRSAVLKVFMYDLSSEFHFGMLDENYGDGIWPKKNITDMPRYPGGLNLQHSVEYWLTLDLLSSVLLQTKQTCTAILVEDSEDADVFFVPYFSSLSYNRHSRMENAGQGADKNVELQEKLVKLLLRQKPWRQSGGINHIIVMHHPNSLHVAREQLRSAMFIVSDFGRYSSQIANVDKDIVAPYKHVVRTYTDDNSTYVKRKTLLFFQGAIVRKEGGIIRQKLYEMLKDEPGEPYHPRHPHRRPVRGARAVMISSNFCLHLAGDTPSSNRLFDAIASHCVPVIISDEIEVPFEDELDYTEFCVFVRSQDALQKGFLMGLLHSIRVEEWTKKWKKLKEVDRHYEFQHPTIPDDAVNMIWKTIARRVPSIKQTLNKRKRYARSRSLTKKKP